MTQLSTNRPLVQVGPQPNVYTVLIIVAILALGIAIGVALYNLMGEVGPDGGYGMSFGDLFAPVKKIGSAN